MDVRWWMRISWKHSSSTLSCPRFHSFASRVLLPPSRIPPHPRFCVVSATCSPCRASASVSSHADWDPLAEATSRGMRPVLVSCESLDCFGRENRGYGGRRQASGRSLHSHQRRNFKVPQRWLRPPQGTSQILSIFCDLVWFAHKDFGCVPKYSALHVLKSSLKYRLGSRGSVGCPCIL